jgi:hypothetical protein
MSRTKLVNSKLLHPISAYAKLLSYLGSPRSKRTSGLYLHSPASEGMWMEA